MSDWQDGLQHARLALTWPWRHALRNRMIRNRTLPVAIMCYHRVADEHPSPRTVSHADFRKQIDWLQAHFELISLDEVRHRIVHGNTRPAVAITFDHGYADNCGQAVPMLVKRGIPVTYFVTTHHTVHNRPIAHHVDSSVQLPSNSIESLRALANAGVEIGSHTRNHLNLGGCTDVRTLFDEVIAAARELESMIDRPIRYFSFPDGGRDDLNPTVFRMLAEHGFAAACSAYGGYNAIHGDGFHLQRIRAERRLGRFKNRLSLEPGMLRMARFDWQAQLPSPSQSSQSNRAEHPSCFVESDA